MVTIFHVLSHTDHKGQTVCNVLCFLWKSSNKFAQTLDSGEIFFVDPSAVYFVKELENSDRSFTETIAIVF